MLQMQRERSPVMEQELLRWKRRKTMSQNKCSWVRLWRYTWHGRHRGLDRHDGRVIWEMRRLVGMTPGLLGCITHLKIFLQF